MSRPVLLVHGWGFDAGIWDRIVALLGRRSVFRAEAGYLGAVPTWPEVPPGTLAVGHSAGGLDLLLRLPAGCAGLVLVNCFTRFAAAPGFPGVPERVLLRMQNEVARTPGAVLRQFRARCGDGGDPAACGVPQGQRLGAGLAALRLGDARAALAGTALPVLALAAPDDPVVTPAHARACFGAKQLRWSDGGGHLLPVSRPDWCADAIDGFAC